MKAGPTEANEEVPLVWLETILYPKNVDNGAFLSLWARSASSVNKVAVTFDFSAPEVVLTSKDKMTWSGVVPIPRDLKSGLHFARFNIEGTNRKSIVRSLDFAVSSSKNSVALKEEKNDAVDEKVKEELQSEGWPIKIKESTVLLVEDKNDRGKKNLRYIGKGEEIQGLFKKPWYRVRLKDGKEGWVKESAVLEPTETFYISGYQSYIKKDYSSAIYNYQKALVINPKHARARYWLAKSYWKVENEDAAISQIKKLLAEEPDNINALVFSDLLSKRYFKEAHAQFQAKNYEKAIAKYIKATELSPSLLSAYAEMGHSYKALGMNPEAENSYKQALRLDPYQAELQTLVAVNKDLKKEDRATEKEKIEITKELELDNKDNLANKSIDMVKNSITRKGTKINIALNNVLNLTRSFGTTINEKGWVTNPEGSAFVVTFLCHQNRSDKNNTFVTEKFEWVVEPKSNQIKANNKNAQLLMSSW